MTQNSLIYSQLEAEAKSENTSGDRLWELARKDDNLALIVAKNIAAPEKVLKELSKNNNSAIRKAVCANPNTVIDILRKLALKTVCKKKGAATRIKYLQHEQPYLSALAKLGWIPDFLILYWQKYWNKQEIFSTIANSSYTPPSILAELGKSNNSLIKRIVAKNPNTPVSTLENLAKDNTEQNKLSDGCLCNIKVNLSMNPNSSSIVLEQLIPYDNFSFTIRKEIAEHPNCSIKVLEKLFEKENSEVLHRVAKNLNTPTFILNKLIKNYDYRYNSIGKKALELLKKREAYLLDSVHSYIKRLFICIPENNKFFLREQWTCTKDDDNKSLGNLQQYREQDKFIEGDLPNHLKTDYLIVRIIILLNKQTPAKFLKNKSFSIFWTERYAIAQNPNTPLDIIQKLTNDANKVVRAAAKDNLENQQILENKQKANI
ncbi:MAG: hypothetical protein ACRC2S_22985 [Waterburya sp.]